MYIHISIANTCQLALFMACKENAFASVNIIICMPITCLTRTHSMTHHRKSPLSQRNLMVIDPLTQSQGYQFHRRLKFVSVSWSTAHPFNLICHMTMFRNLIFYPYPRSQGAGTPKMCRCMCHLCELITHQIWLNFGEICLYPHPTPPPPLRFPQVPPLGMTQAAKQKSRLICYIFHLWEDTQSLV